MTPEDQERIVGELEIALDRLQALYNQYFMGIEKLEPTIPRKDVERKIQAMRKEQIRNTAIRFRLQTQIQKYNTQSTYWRRICRQIEEGTYKRDVMRAKKRTAVRDEREVASRALSQLDAEQRAEQRAEQPPTYDLSDAGLDIDDPFAEGPTAVHQSQGALEALDDPFADPAPPASDQPPAPAQPQHAAPVPDASFAGDPDKTPVPIAGSGVHNLQEKLIEDTKHGREEAGELADFFSRRSVPPPPPPTTGVGPAPKPPSPAKADSPQPEAPEPTPARTRAARKPARTASAQGGLSQDRMEAVYRAYVSAREKCNENTNISFEKVSKLLRKQLSTSSGVKDFKVVIREGKAVIKTVKK